MKDKPKIRRWRLDLTRFLVLPLPLTVIADGFLSCPLPKVYFVSACLYSSTFFPFIHYVSSNPIKWESTLVLSLGSSWLLFGMFSCQVTTLCVSWLSLIIWLLCDFGASNWTKYSRLYLLVHIFWYMIPCLPKCFLSSASTFSLLDLTLQFSLFLEVHLGP